MGIILKRKTIDQISLQKRIFKNILKIISQSIHVFDKCFTQLIGKKTTTKFRVFFGKKQLLILTVFACFLDFEIQLVTKTIKSSPSQMFLKIGVLKNVANFQTKTVLASLLNKVAGLKVYNFIKKKLQQRCFTVIRNFFKNSFLIQYIRWLLTIVRRT